MATKRIKFEDIKERAGATDKRTLDRRASSDCDAPVPTKKELKEFQRVAHKDKPRAR